MITILGLIAGLFTFSPPTYDQTKPLPSKLECGQNSYTVERLVGEPDAFYQCYEIGAMRYGKKLYVFYDGELQGELPMYSYFDKCIDHRRVTGFKSLCAE